MGAFMRVLTPRLRQQDEVLDPFGRPRVQPATKLCRLRPMCRRGPRAARDRTDQPSRRRARRRSTRTMAV